MTAKEAKIRNLYKQWIEINNLIEQLDGASCFVIRTALFPEVVECFKKTGWDILYSDDDLIPAYFFDCSCVELTDEELTLAFQEDAFADV